MNTSNIFYLRLIKDYVFYVLNHSVLYARFDNAHVFITFLKNIWK